MPRMLVLFAVFVSMALTDADAIQRCPHYFQPKNGRVLCDSLFNLFCAPECAPGHVFASRPAVVYVCNAVTGNWYTYPPGHSLPWPDCVKKTGDFENQVMEEVNARRMEISKRISNSQKAIFPQSYSTSQQKNRYKKLYKYVERARELYKKRQNPEYMAAQGGRAINKEHGQTQSYFTEKSPRTFGAANSSVARQRGMWDAAAETELRDSHQRYTAYGSSPNVYVAPAASVREMRGIEQQKKTESDPVSNNHSNGSNESQRRIAQETVLGSPAKTDSSSKGTENMMTSLQSTTTQVTTTETQKDFRSVEQGKREKLFYFPINRVALIKMLPKDLHQRYTNLMKTTSKQP